MSTYRLVPEGLANFLMQDPDPILGMKLTDCKTITTEELSRIGIILSPPFNKGQKSA